MELRDLLIVLRHRKWVVVRTAFIVAVTALAVSLLMPPVYQGEAKILISEKGSSADLFGSLGLDISSQPERGLQTQVQLMQVRPLLENTIRQLNLGMTPEELANSVKVQAVGQTNIVSIQAESSDPDRAAEIANTLAGEFVTWSREYKRESINAAVEEVATRLETARSEILDLGRKIQQEGKSDELSAELAIATGNYTTLAGKLEELRINSQLEVGTGRIVSPAVVTGLPVAPSPLRNTALGAVLGVVVGMGTALLYEYLDNTLKTTEEIEEIVSGPVLGYVPLEKFDKDDRRRATILTHPSSAAAEAYRVLRNNLDFINFERDITALMVTSAAPAEGKSTLAANLAAGLAQTGKRVVLLAVDFRKPTTEQFFGVRNVVGLSDVLMGAHTLKSALQRPRNDLELLILTSGKMPPNPSELLGSEKMRDLLEELKEWADWVIVDTPPLLAVADGAAVARWCDGVLVVLKGGQSTRDELKKARGMLQNVGARVLGAVVWGLEGRNASGSYGYGMGTYSSYNSYADYYNSADTSSRRSKDQGSYDDNGIYIPEKSFGRRLGERVGRSVALVLGLLVVLVIAALVAYMLDRALGLQILSVVTGVQ